MTHTITEKELNEWLCRPQWQVFASSAGRGSAKRLEVDGAADNHVFRVMVRGHAVFLGADKTAAVAAYNDAQ